MRICDRCKKENTRTVLLNRIDGSEYDLCKKCTEDFSEFLTPQKEEQEAPAIAKKAGRPKRKIGGFNAS